MVPGTFCHPYRLNISIPVTIEGSEEDLQYDAQSKRSVCPYIMPCEPHSSCGPNNTCTDGYVSYYESWTLYEYDATRTNDLFQQIHSFPGKGATSEHVQLGDKHFIAITTSGANTIKIYDRTPVTFSFTRTQNLITTHTLTIPSAATIPQQLTLKSCTSSSCSTATTSDATSQPCSPNGIIKNGLCWFACPTGSVMSDPSLEQICITPHSSFLSVKINDLTGALGKTICCPKGWVRYGDGSACRTVDWVKNIGTNNYHNYCHLYGSSLGGAAGKPSCPHPCGSVLDVLSIETYTCDGTPVTNIPGRIDYKYTCVAKTTTCTPRQVSNSDKAATGSITGTFIFYFISIHFFSFFFQLLTALL